MNIILASFEIIPFAKTGGLADVVNALAVEWQKSGHQSISIMPKLKGIDTKKYGFKKLDHVLNVPMGFQTEHAAIWQGNYPSSDAIVYLIEHNEYFDRDGIYGNPESFLDNDRRFIFFSRAIFEVAKAVNFTPDIIHAHDYHAAFSMAFLKSYYKHEKRFANTAGVYTIHNLAYQGKFDPWRVMDFTGFGMKQFYPGSWFEQDGAINCMKVGLKFADKVTTVSPNYANEIRNPYYSEGLQGVINEVAGDMVGVLNGVMYQTWNPETDSYIHQNYSANNLTNKKKQKHSLLKSFGLTAKDNLDIPLLGMVSRLTEQKGIDIMKDKLDEYLAKGTFRIAFLGSGNQSYVDFFNYLAWKYPKHAHIYIGYDESRSHNIIAASDYILVPSRFEPCGLTQMYGLKYGTIPIVRATGGLVDTVHEYIPETGKGTGFVFNNYNVEDFDFALRRALSIYDDKKHWPQIRANAMAEDYSATRQAKEYIEVFKWAKERV